MLGLALGRSAAFQGTDGGNWRVWLLAGLGKAGPVRSGGPLILRSAVSERWSGPQLCTGAGLGEAYWRYNATKETNWIDGPKALFPGLAVGQPVGPAQMRWGFCGTGSTTKRLMNSNRRCLDPINSHAYRELAQTYERACSGGRATFRKAIMHPNYWATHNVGFYYRNPIRKSREVFPASHRTDA